MFILCTVVLIMYIDACRTSGQYVRHLLRQSYRENGKVKHRTIANLSSCSPEEIETIKLALRHWQVIARVIDPGSRLSAIRLAGSHAACDALRLRGFCEDGPMVLQGVNMPNSISRHWPESP